MLDIRVTRSKVLFSSGLGRTWHVRRLSLAGGLLIWETRRKYNLNAVYKVQHIRVDRMCVCEWDAGTSPCYERWSDSHIWLHISSSAIPFWFWDIKTQTHDGRVISQTYYPAQHFYQHLTSDLKHSSDLRPENWHLLHPNDCRPQSSKKKKRKRKAVTMFWKEPICPDESLFILSPHLDWIFLGGSQRKPSTHISYLPNT